jgi:alpha-tubulin suppressor-like RCC1 family protein
VWCWGDNAVGQVGQGSDNSVNYAQKVPGLPAIRSIAAGGNSTCAVTEAGRIWCWGANGSAQLGKRQSTNSFRSPVEPDFMCELSP